MKSQLRFTPDSIENDVWLQASVLSPCALLITKCRRELYVTCCITAEVFNSEVRDFDPFNLKEELWKPILGELRAQQAKEEELKVRLLTEKTQHGFSNVLAEFQQCLTRVLAMSQQSFSDVLAEFQHFLSSVHQQVLQSFSVFQHVLARLSTFQQVLASFSMFRLS